MAGEYVKLTAQQKDEIRRLTQLANRRIKFAEKQYKRSGGTVLPREVVGDLQIREKWATPNTPISRSVKFESEKDYRKQLQFLRSFDPKASKGGARPSISQFTMVQRHKTMDALETSFGIDMSEHLEAMINKMSAPQLSKFWDTYSKKSARLVFKYSSDKAMSQTMQEVFGEDLTGLQSSLADRPK